MVEPQGPGHGYGDGSDPLRLFTVEKMSSFQTLDKELRHDASAYGGAHRVRTVVQARDLGQDRPIDAWSYRWPIGPSAPVTTTGRPHTNVQKTRRRHLAAVLRELRRARDWGALRACWRRAAVADGL